MTIAISRSFGTFILAATAAAGSACSGADGLPTDFNETDPVQQSEAPEAPEANRDQARNSPFPEELLLAEITRDSGSTIYFAEDPGGGLLVAGTGDSRNEDAELEQMLQAQLDPATLYEALTGHVAPPRLAELSQFHQQRLAEQALDGQLADGLSPEEQLLNGDPTDADSDIALDSAVQQALEGADSLGLDSYSVHHSACAWMTNGGTQFCKPDLRGGAHEGHQGTSTQQYCRMDVVSGWAHMRVDWKNGTNNSQQLVPLVIKDLEAFEYWWHYNYDSRFNHIRTCLGIGKTLNTQFSLRGGYDHVWGYGKLPPWSWPYN